MCQQGGNPFGGPCAFGIIVDVAQGLERQRIGLAQCMMLAAHRQNGGARRQSLVEDIDLRTLITAELQAEQREDGIVVLTFDRAGESVNTFAQDVLIELEALLERLSLDPPKGLVLRSGKAKGFIAGADIREFAEFDAKGTIGDSIRRGQQRSEEHTSELPSLMRISYAV